MAWSTLFKHVGSPTGRRFASQGLTLIEVLIATFIIGVVVVGLFSLFILAMRSAQEGERRVAAIALANERMEMIRNLPFVNVGTQGGIPAGDISQAENITRNGTSYTVKTEIRHVDDVYDGSVGGSTVTGDERVVICHIPPGNSNKQTTMEVAASALDAHLAHGDYTGVCGAGGDGTNLGDEYNADYKLARVEVDWSGQYHVRPVLLVTHISPQGVEGGELGGTLDLQLASADGAAVSDATVEIINDNLDPPIQITTETNAEGRVVMPGFPEMAEGYQVMVGKDGYSSEQTYDVETDFIPDAEHSHISMIVREVTSKLFFIDRVAEVTVSFVDENETNVIGNLSYHWQGQKTIGEQITPSGASEPKYKVDIDRVVGPTGQDVIPDLEWDTYQLSVPVASGYLVKQTWPILPLPVEPGAVKDLQIVLAPYTERSVQVTVVNMFGEPVDNATVRLELNAFSIEHGTGIPGQVLLSDLPEIGIYTLYINAPGYEEYQQAVEVMGNETVRAELVTTN